jgi:hypothetical protein
MRFLNFIIYNLPISIFFIGVGGAGVVGSVDKFNRAKAISNFEAKNN